MSEDKRSLCSIEQVIRSVVDENDLDAGQKRHIEQCLVCRQERRNLAGRLELLGRMTADYTPTPVQRVALPDEGHPLMLKRGPGWQLAFGTAAGFALVVLVAVWVVFYGGVISPTNQLDVAREMSEDEVLMAEISVLEENPLPEAYREISPEITSDDIDEYIFDFIVPVSSGDQGSRGKEA